MSDEIESLVREYVRFHEADLRARGLLAGDTLDPAFRAALERALGGRGPARIDGVPLPEPPEDRPE